MKKSLYFLSGTIFTSVLAAGVWAHADSSAQSTNQINQSTIQSSQHGTLLFDQIKHLEFKWECADNNWTGSYQKDNSNVQAAIESHLNGNANQLSGDQAVASLRHLFDQLPLNPQQAQDRMVKQFSPDLYVSNGSMGLQVDLMDGRHLEYQFKDGKLISFNQNNSGNSQQHPAAGQSQVIVQNNGQGTANGQGNANGQTTEAANATAGNQQNSAANTGVEAERDEMDADADKDKNNNHDKEKNKVKEKSKDKGKEIEKKNNNSNKNHDDNNDQEKDD